MKKRLFFFGSCIVALILAAAWLFLPLGGGTLGPLTATPKEMIYPVSTLAKATREVTRIVKGNEGETSWRRQVNSHADDLLQDYTVNGQLGPSVAKFASEVLGRPVALSQVIDVNGTAQDMLASLRLNQISASVDSVYFIEENGVRVMVVKAFRDFTHANSLFLPQLSACAAIEELGLKRSRSMDLLGVGKCRYGRSKYGLLALDVSPGRMACEYLFDIIKHPAGSPERAQALEAAKRAVERVAVAIAELHSVPSKGITCRTPEQTAAQLAHVTNSLKYLTKVGKDLDGDEILKQVIASEELCQQTPIPTAYCHGGINWKNFLYDPKGDRLTMIDTAGLHRELDPWDQPQGTAEAEYAQLEQRILAMDSAVYSQEELNTLAATLNKHYFRHLERPWSEAYYRLAVDGFHLERFREWVRKGGVFKQPSEQKRADDGLQFALEYFRTRALKGRVEGTS